MIGRALAWLAAAGALAGCGGAGGDGETASLWVTRDEGARVLLVREVPAGLTVMQALDREADVETRYGGRFVHAVDGVEGSLAGGRDWFYFVNGYESDRSATEYRLRPGDVAWWDFRSWRKRERVPLAVGAFPEPFLHGYAGKRRPAVVLYDDARLQALARRLGEVVGAEDLLRFGVDRAAPSANVLLVRVRGPARFTLADGARVTQPGDAVVVEISEPLARRLARDPAAFRFRYEVR